jgi:hypothetical protein
MENGSPKISPAQKRYNDMTEVRDALHPMTYQYLLHTVKESHPELNPRQHGNVVLKLLTPSKKNVQLLADILSLDRDVRSWVFDTIANHGQVYEAFTKGENPYTEVDLIAKLLDNHQAAIQK